VRIVTGVTRQVQVFAGRVHDSGYHVARCPRCLWPVLASQVAVRREELILAEASEHRCRAMPDHMHLFGKAHPSYSPSLIASQFKGLTLGRLRAGFPHLWSRMPALWSQSHFGATAGVAPAQLVYRYTCTRNERGWRKERAQ
jgi:REP-associated tyrosine transposase